MTISQGPVGFWLGYGPCWGWVGRFLGLGSGGTTVTTVDSASGALSMAGPPSRAQRKVWLFRFFDPSSGGPGGPGRPPKATRRGFGGFQGPCNSCNFVAWLRALLGGWVGRFFSLGSGRTSATTVHSASGALSMESGPAALTATIKDTGQRPWMSPNPVNLQGLGPWMAPNLLNL
jgi:hypothetical protein